MKIYTRTGDDGTTGLIGGGRVAKSEARLDCYGTVDELNASIGVAACAAGDESSRQSLRQVQDDLFVIGAHLAAENPADAERASVPALDESMINRLEMQIDAAESVLPPLRQFILPGGTEAAARLHVARTICRRTERLLVAFGQDRPLPPLLLTYVNRLSDWLFVHARLANHLAGVPDLPWRKS